MTYRKLSEVMRLGAALLASGPAASSTACEREVDAAVDALGRALAIAGRRGGGRDGEPAPATRRTLTPRERQVVRLLQDGASYKDVAHELGITFMTAQSRIKAIYAKLGVHSKAELQRAVGGET